MGEEAATIAEQAATIAEQAATIAELRGMFHALAAAYDIKQRSEHVEIVFQGAGTRWAGVLTQKDHPAHALYKAVEDKVAGVSCGCADVFGSRADAEKNGFSLITTNQVPGTSGLPSLAKYARDGYSVLTF